MKYLRIGVFVLGILALAVIIVSSIGTEKLLGPYVDIYRMEDTYHEYGWWLDPVDALAGRAPEKTIKVPLVDSPTKPGKLEYAYYPTNVEFAKFLATCVHDTGQMNLKGLYNIVHR